MTDKVNNSKTTTITPPENGIGQRIKDLRKKLDLTVEQLSALTARYDYGTENDNEKGIAVSTLYLYEKGDRTPRTKELRLLCDSLNVTPTFLVMGQDWSVSPAMRSELESVIDKLNNLLEGDVFNSNKDWREIEHMANLLEIKNESGN